jgi:GcrA cell cycle regulator
MSWTDERVETLKRMWSEGQSASQIAKELGGVTRNAVIGKVHRLGLSNRVGGPGMPDGPDGAEGAGEAAALDATLARTGARSEPRGESRGEGRGDVRSDGWPDNTDDARSDAPADARPESRPGGVGMRPDTAMPAAAAPSPGAGSGIGTVTGSGPVRKPVIVPGQPLPPQPSANEISPEALASVREVEKKARRISLMELTERTCKWPIGDPASDDFWFCGLAAQPGKPYCEAHVGVAFQPMSSRRDRRR